MGIDPPRKATTVIDELGNAIGLATQWNTHGIGECIVQYYDGSADSAVFSELKFAFGSEEARKMLNARRELMFG